MCGFVVSVGPNEALRASLEKLAHRGPDSTGIAIVSLAWATVTVGMSRLAVVGNNVPTPFACNATGTTVAYNGEIYNWRDLRSDLSDGVPWASHGDTEIIGRAWRRWGAAMLDRFNGMFSFVLVDPRQNVVFVARDRAGEKPLYWREWEGGVHLASEIKGLPGPLTEARPPEVDVLEFDCLEQTRFSGVFRMPPGTSMLLNGASSPKPQSWWSFRLHPDPAMTWADAVEETKETLTRAIELRANSTVKSAVLVSGGLDSALVQSVAKSPNVYTLTFPEFNHFDVMADARLAAGIEPTSVTFGGSEAMAALKAITWHLDTPATWTAVGQWFLAKQMAADGVTVALSGEGADELFGGYARYKMLWWTDQMLADPSLVAYRPLMRHVHGDQGDGLLARLLSRGQGDAGMIVQRFASGEGLANRAAVIDWHTTMQVLLRMADRMFAAHSIENRSPFLDVDVIDLAQRMPMAFKVTGTETKAVLREAARGMDVHPTITDAPSKKGLAIPWNQWFPVKGARGEWDRGGFVVEMERAWREAFGMCYTPLTP